MTVLWPDNISAPGIAMTAQLHLLLRLILPLPHFGKLRERTISKVNKWSNYSTLTKPPNLPGKDPSMVPRCQAHDLMDH